MKNQCLLSPVNGKPVLRGSYIVCHFCSKRQENRLENRFRHLAPVAFSISFPLLPLSNGVGWSFQSLRSWCGASCPHLQGKAAREAVRTCGQRTCPAPRGCRPGKGWHLTLTELFGSDAPQRPREISKPTTTEPPDQRERFRGQGWRPAARSATGHLTPGLRPTGVAADQAEGQLGLGTERRTAVAAAGIGVGRNVRCSGVGAMFPKVRPRLGMGEDGERKKEQLIRGAESGESVRLSPPDLAQNQRGGRGRESCKMAILL